jgi:hypothetical protein
MVAPSGRFSISISSACLLAARGVLTFVAAAFGLVARLACVAFLARAVVEDFDMAWTLRSYGPRPSRPCY